MNISGLRGCLWACLRFCGGAIIGSIAAMLVWQYIHPPGGPNYGDGIDYGFAMMGWMWITGFVCGLYSVFVKRK